MALRVRIVGVVFILCTISPLLASAYSNVQGQQPIRDKKNPRPEDDSAQGRDNKATNKDLPDQGIVKDLPYQNNDEALPQPANGEDDQPRQASLADLLFPGGEEQPVQEEEPPTPEGLRANFYRQSCPAAADIIKRVLNEASTKDLGIGANLVRLFSHDCLVQGCDASVLLDATPAGQPTEKLATANGVFIGGTEVIDQMKAEIEIACPGVVSCADILALSTRDALVASGLPEFEMPLGRRDSVTSLKDLAEHDLPIPVDEVNHIVELFQKKGLNVEDLATLIGAHSIGNAHCGSFGYRTLSPEKSREMNPKIPLNIRHICWDAMAMMPIDAASQFKLDSLFYKGLLDRTGILESDHRIAFDPRTSPYVRKYAGNEQVWFEKFTTSLIKLSRTGVLTGNAGQIRKQCRFVN